MKIKGMAAALLCLLACVWPASGGHPDEALQLLVARYLAASSVDADARLKEIYKTQPDIEKLYDAVARGPEYSDAYKTALDWNAEQGFWYKRILCRDGIERYVSFLLPEKYDPATRAPVLIYLYPTFRLGSGLHVKASWGGWQEWAREEGAILMALSQNDAQWIDDAGARALLEGFEFAKHHFNVDENRVFVTGASEGGSGCFLLAQAAPTAFAGLLPLGGSPVELEARAAGHFPGNYRNARLFATNGPGDRFTPSTDLNMYREALLKNAPASQWRVADRLGEAQEPPAALRAEMAAFMKTAVRDPLPKRIDWECGPNLEWPEAYWLRVLRLHSNAGGGELPPLAAPVMSPRLGINVEPVDGGGLRIRNVVEGGAADAAGLHRDDIMLDIDGQAMNTVQDLISLLESQEDMERRVEVNFRSTSGVFSAQVTLKRRATFVRPEGCARVVAEADGNRIAIQSNGVATLRLCLSPDMFDLSQPVVVTVNGAERFAEIVHPDPDFLLRDARARRDRSLRYAAAITVTIPESK